MTIVSSNGAIIGSNFLFSNENWTITGNKVANSATIFENKNRGSQLSNYIYSVDDEINIVSGKDIALWYFDAPTKFQGNLGIAYGGSLSFTLSSFSGNFDELNGQNVR